VRAREGHALAGSVLASPVRIIRTGHWHGYISSMAVTGFSLFDDQAQ